MGQITIRVATPEDAPALAGLSDTLGYPASVQDVQQRLVPIMASPDNRVLVACSAAGAVVAWIHVVIANRIESDTFAEVGGLVVAEDQRGQGIGGRLLKAAEEWAIGRGVGRMRIRSRTTRTAAHAFYGDSGYARIKQQEVFEKRLP